jgi:hypothetical protein
LWRFCIGAHHSSTRFDAGVEATLREVVEKDKRNTMCDESAAGHPFTRGYVRVMISAMQSKRIGISVLEAAR